MHDAMPAPCPAGHQQEPVGAGRCHRLATEQEWPRAVPQQQADAGGQQGRLLLPEAKAGHPTHGNRRFMAAVHMQVITACPRPFRRRCCKTTCAAGCCRPCWINLAHPLPNPCVALLYRCCKTACAAPPRSCWCAASPPRPPAPRKACPPSTLPRARRRYSMLGGCAGRLAG